jgi:hypothetical protein
MTLVAVGAGSPACALAMFAGVIRGLIARFRLRSGDWLPVISRHGGRTRGMNS